MTKLHTVTVYAGSADNLPKIFLDGAYELGKLLAEQGRVLVFGAGKTGLMGAVADGALAYGGEVIGVINDGLNLPNLAHAGLSRVETLPDLQSRQKRMSELGDAFIALPGGFGTLYETFEALTWAQLQMHHKGVGFLNIGGYYDHQLAMLEHAIAEHFIYASHQALFTASADPADLLEKLDQYTSPSDLGRWLER
jgi:uncharacterized protein (TIGR00730 family)